MDHQKSFACSLLNALLKNNFSDWHVNEKTMKQESFPILKCLPFAIWQGIEARIENSLDHYLWSYLPSLSCLPLFPPQISLKYRGSFYASINSCTLSSDYFLVFITWGKQFES